MPKDDRKIVSAIRMPADREGKRARRTFKAGDEDELAEAATKSQLTRYAEEGAITGDWGVKVQAEAPKPSAKK